MKRQRFTKPISSALFTCAVFAFIVSACSTASAQGDNWAGWRGPHRNGHAGGEQTPPVEWSEEKNILWKAEVPGFGHSSPTIVGEKIFMATCEWETQSIACFSMADGEKLWDTAVNEGGLARIHRNNTHASQTVVSDGTKVFTTFLNNNRIQLVALDMDGNIAWDKTVSQYRSNRGFGYGQTPIIYKNMVIATNDNEGESVIKAFNAEDGEEVWTIERPSVTSFSTPVIIEFEDGPQMVIPGTGKVIGYNPETGEELWSTPTAWSVCCGTAVWDAEENLVFVSGGFPQSATYAIDVTNGKVIWSNRTKSYEQSMIYVDGHLYTLTDRGVAYCWNGEDGEEKWSQSIKGGISASPVYANGNIYFTTEDSTVYVVKASPEGFEMVSENRLGTVGFATPSIVSNKIFTRVGDSSGQQWLFCIGEQ